MPLTQVEVNRKTYERDSGLHECGYWSVCDDHACGCAISNNVDGFDNGVYQRMKEDLQKQAEEFYNDTDIYDMEEYLYYDMDNYLDEED